jgi:hypothetical protein
MPETKQGHPGRATLNQLVGFFRISPFGTLATCDTSMNSISIDEAIERLPLNLLAQRLAIAGEIPDRDGKTVSCWFPDRHLNGDRRPSFNLYSGLTKFKCFACGIEGRGPDLIAHSLRISEDEAIKRFRAMAGGTVTAPSATPPPRAKRSIDLPPDLHEGTEQDWRALADLRGFSLPAIGLASSMGILRFGSVHQYPSWIVTDESRRIAEARRMDGKPFPAKGALGERKAHTLAGSDKSWPVGLMPRHSAPQYFRRIVIVEGGPDLLAAYHFLLEHGVLDTLPVAMLGRSCKSLHVGACAYLRGREVRAIPHIDPDGGGVLASREWLRRFHHSGARVVGAFNLDGLIRRDGILAMDLNDCLFLSELEQLEIRTFLTHE